jgi:hypothetical protein
MLRLIGATLCGLIFCFVAPLFVPLSLMVLGMLAFMRHGYGARDAFLRVNTLLDQLFDAMGSVGSVVLALGLCALAALAAGIAAARIAPRPRPWHPYIASLLIILVAAGTIYFAVADFRIDPIYLWLFIAGGTVCVLLGTVIGRRTHWPDPRPDPSPAPARRLP